MNFAYLHEFIMLAQTKSYWEAAERLFLGQSTLTKHIQQMEKELGVTLFERTSRHVELSSYGKLLLPYAKNIVAMEYEYTEKLALQKEKNAGHLVLGSIPSLSQYGISGLIADFCQTGRGFEVRVCEEDSAVLREGLLQGKYELAFLREVGGAASSDSDLEKIPFITDCMTAVLPPEHPLSGRACLRLEELREERFILLRQQTLLYELCLDSCRRAGFQPRVAFDCHRLDTIIDLVEHGMGISLLMDRHVDSAKGRVCAVPLEPAVTSTVSLCWREKEKLSAAALSFVEFLRCKVKVPDT